MKNFLDMKDDSLLLPIRFEVDFEIVLIETSYTLFTSVSDALAMGWIWIGDGLAMDWR